MPSLCKEINSDNIGYCFIICNYLLVIQNSITTLYILIFVVYYKINYSEEKRQEEGAFWQIFHHYLFFDLIYKPVDSSAKGLFKNITNPMCFLQQPSSLCLDCPNLSCKIHFANTISYYHHQLLSSIVILNENHVPPFLPLHILSQLLPAWRPDLQSSPFSSDISHTKKCSQHEVTMNTFILQIMTEPHSVIYPNLIIQNSRWDLLGTIPQGQKGPRKLVDPQWQHPQSTVLSNMQEAEQEGQKDSMDENDTPD